MNFECKIQEVKPSLTVALRFTSSVDSITSDLMQNFPKVVDYLFSIGERPGGFPYVCIYNIHEKEWQMECGFPVTHPVPGNAEIIASTIPGGRCATTMHRGPLTEMGKSYERLRSWMNEHGLTAKGPFYEVPMSDPRYTKPEDLYAGLMIPI